MYFILPGALLLIMIILIVINERLKKTKKFKKIGLSFIKIVNIILFITFIISFNPNINEYILDSLHITIIESEIYEYDNNFYSEDYGYRVSVIEYPVYDLATTSFARIFKVVNNEKFDNYITTLPSFSEKYIQEDITIYTLDVNQAKFYVIYSELNNSYSLMSATAIFKYQDSGINIWDYVPVIPCSYFNNDDIGLIETNSVTFQTEYTWNETKAFYQDLGTEIFSIDEAQKTVLIYNSVADSNFELVYNNNSITLERLTSSD